MADDYATAINNSKKFLKDMQKAYGKLEADTGISCDKAAFMIRKMKEIQAELKKIADECEKNKVTIFGIIQKIDLEGKKYAAAEKKMEGPDSWRLVEMKRDAIAKRDEFKKKFDSERTKWNDTGFDLFKGVFAMQFKVLEQVEAAYAKW